MTSSLQKIKSFTKTDNELFIAICRYRCSGIKKDIIWIILRYTDGYHREEHELSLGFIAKAIDYKPHKISTAVNELIAANVIKVVREYKTNHTSRILSLNKDYTTWLNSSQKSNGRNHSQMGNCNSSQIGNTSIPKEGIETVPQKGTKKENVNKILNKNIKKEISFEEFSLPFELEMIDGFSDIYQDWLEYCKETKNPLTLKSIELQIKDLLDWHLQGIDVIEVIKTSIKNNWKGLFKPKVQSIQRKYKNLAKGETDPEEVAEYLRRVYSS